MRTITIYEMPYTVEDDGDGGSMAVNQQDEPDVATIVVEDVLDTDETAAELAAAILNDEGITQDNGHWFGDADPDATMDYRTGELTERTATLAGFTDAELDEIRGHLA